MDSSRPCSSFRSIATLGFWCSGLCFTSGLPPRFSVAGFSISFSLPNGSWDNGVMGAWFRARRRERLPSAGLVIGERILEAEMKAFIVFAVILVALAAATAADAKGCLKGAAVGSVAGH